MAGPTAWSSDYPLDHGKQIGNYDIFIQPWYAARERSRDLGHELFPFVDNNPGYEGLFVWEKGIVTGAVDNGDGTSTITDSTKTWGLIGSWNNPWISLNGSNLAMYAPVNWAMGLGNDDVTQATAGLITVNTATTAKLATRLNDLVVSKQVPNISFFIGQPYYIYAAGEPFWYQQWPEWQNVPRRAYGTMTSGTTTTMRVNNAFWKTGIWAGKELMVRDSTGAYFRQTITANTTDITTTPPAAVVTFSPALTHAVDGDYAIIDASGRFLLGHIGCNPFVWYTGEMTGSYSHPPNDTPLVMAPVPQGNSSAYSEGQDPTLCPAETTKPMFDINLWSDPQNVCGPAGHAFNPNVTKSLRWLQRKCREMSGGFIPVGAPHGSERSAFNNFVPATWFASWGATSYSGTIGAAGTNGDGESGVGVSIGGSIAYDELLVFWAVTDSAGNAILAGEGKLSSASFLVGGPADSMYTGKPIKISPGEKRFFPRRFERMFGITRWTPDADPDSVDGTGYIIPPREPLAGETAGPGTWIHIPPSDHYSVTGALGGRAQSTLAVDAMADGHIARYAGNSFFDPTTGFGPDINGNVPPFATYLDRAFIGKRSGKYQFSRNQSRSGATTTFTATQLTDKSKNFWICDFWGGTDGVLYTHSGSDSISGTTVILASKASSAFFTQTPVRFPGHVIQGQTGVDADSNPIWASCLITAQASITHLTLATGMPSVTNWRIREPDSILDIWKDRDLTLTPYDVNGVAGTPILTTVSGLSDDSVFYPAITIPAGTVSIAWVIDEPKVYGTYKRVSGKWKPCSGADAVRLGVATPTDFHAGDVFANEPDVVVRYGMMGPDDRPAEVQNQLKYGIDVLMDTPDVGGWISKGENNQYISGDDNGITNSGDPATVTLAVAKSLASAHWGTTSGFSSGPLNGSSEVHSINQAPTASAGVAYALTADGTDVWNCGANATINYAYYQISELATFYGRPTHTDEGFGWPAMDSFDTDPHDLINCAENFKQEFLSVNGFALRTWKSIGALSSDGVGHEISAKVWDTTEPPFPSATSATLFVLLSSDPVVTCTTEVQFIDAGSAGGSAVILDDRAVRHWNNGFHA